MGVFDVHDAKARLSHLLDRAAQGEEIIIAKRACSSRSRSELPLSLASPDG